MGRHNDLTNMMECRLFRGMSEAECSNIHTVIKPVTFGYRKKEAIISQGDIASNISLIVKGRVIGIRYYYGGDSHILRVFDEMDVICLEAVMSSFQKSPVTLIADEPSEILSFSIARLLDKRFLDEALRSKVCENMFHLLADENIRLIYKAEVLSQKVPARTDHDLFKNHEGKEGAEFFLYRDEPGAVCAIPWREQKCAFCGAKYNAARRDH